MKSNLVEHKHIAIIGAGPVGLLTARLFQQAGVAVTVYERDADADCRISGGTLDIHKMTGQQALAKAGLLDAYYRAARPTGERGLDVAGNIIMREFPGPSKLYDRPEIDRNDLRRLLVGSLEPNTVVWGKHFASLQEVNGQFLLQFEDGTIALADVVIGANGGRSKVSSYVTDSRPIYTGSFIIQGEVLHPDQQCAGFKQLCQEDNLMVIGDSQKFLFSQIKSGGVINYYVAFRAKEDFLVDKQIDIDNPTQVTSFLTTLCWDWDVRYKELFAATVKYTALPMRRMPLTSKWHTTSSITLIGDAAHVMPPFAGIGVNIGLLDALYLTQNLVEGGFGSIREAMDKYESTMFVYATEAQAATTEAETGFFAEESVEEQLHRRQEWNKQL